MLNIQNLINQNNLKNNKINLLKNKHTSNIKLNIISSTSIFNNYNSLNNQKDIAIYPIPFLIKTTLSPPKELSCYPISISTKLQPEHLTKSLLKNP